MTYNLAYILNSFGYYTGLALHHSAYEVSTRCDIEYIVLVHAACRWKLIQ